MDHAITDGIQHLQLTKEEEEEISICGVSGHDEKHCSRYQGKSECHRQYGDWIKANSSFKGVFEKQKATSSGGLEEKNGRRHWCSAQSDDC